MDDRIIWRGTKDAGYPIPFSLWRSLVRGERYETSKRSRTGSSTGLVPAI